MCTAAIDASLPQRRASWIFETGSPKYDWLNKIITVGVGKTVPGKAAYSIYHIL